MAVTRRDLLRAAASFGLCAALPGVGRAENRHEDKEQREAPISAPEDLMREHGVLDRILLVYEEGVRRVRANQPITPDVSSRSATIVRSFVHDYHEQIEQTLVFPEFVRHSKHADLVAILRTQHEAGRRLTDVILRVTTPEAWTAPASRDELVRAIDAFVRMVRPHAAFEETVLFPAMYEILPARDVAAIGEKAEDQEHERIGEHGFERTVAEVAAIEKLVGLDDLSRFTAREMAG